MICIFDLDGTLLDTVGDIAAAVNEALVQNGFPTHRIEECVPFLGNGTDKLLFRALPEGARTSENVARLRSVYQNYYNAHLTVFTKPYDGIRELLFTLQQRHIQLAVASNKYHQAVKQIVQICFPTIRFAAVFGQRDGFPTKPDAQLVEEILQLCGEKKEDSLYVGDSDVDMQTARNAGVRACGVTWGYKPREVLLKYHPDYVVDSPQEILSLV